MRPGDVTPRFKAPRPAKRARRTIRRVSDRRVASLEALDAARKIVEARSKGLCEIAMAHDCTRRATEVHHVKRRSQGGSNAPSNLRHACPAGHRAVHANPMASFLSGDLLPGWA